MNEQVKAISELKEYLEKLQKEWCGIEIGKSLEIPPFCLPSWPEELGNTRVKLYNRALLLPKSGTESKLINLQKKWARSIAFCISSKGKISIEGNLYFFGPFAEEYNLGESNSASNFSRVSCFITFTQFIKPLCQKIMKKLSKRLRHYEQEVEEYKRICEAVERSFEPLIPFVVADALGGKE